jgi:N-acetylmuramoyl-L-alanine amidase
LCEDETFTFQLGGLDPIDSPTGVQHRLRNLGLYDGAIDGVAGPMTRSALRKFQEMLDLRASGEPDTGTLDSLKNEHGS